MRRCAIKMCSLNLYLLFLCVAISDGYKILGLYQLPNKSHYILAKKLFKDLAEKGHEVTFFTPFKSEEKIPNTVEITVEGLQHVIQGIGPIVNMEDDTPFDKIFLINNIQYNITKLLLSSKEMQELLKSNAKFDAVINYHYLNEALLPIAHHFKAPLILFKSMPFYVSESFLFKHPSPSSYVPNILNEYTGRMSFWQRLRNSFYDVVMILHYHWTLLPKYRELAHKYSPGKPKLDDFLTNASLILINSHVSTNEALPQVPDVVEIGGFHIEDPKPLAKDLQNFLDASKNGVILFSMGSGIRSADFPKEEKDALISSFSKLKENVLWKWEDEEMPGKPPNVKILKWIPQSDVLAHPNVKAFIGHGGLLSTMESVYYAKPIIGIPIYTDQKMNIALAKAYEYAVEVPYKSLTEQSISEALAQVLNNSKYKKNVETRSKIMRDRPMKPSESALFWIEYVIRHQGAPHLGYPGFDLNWFQRNLLDIEGFIVFILFLITVFIALIFKTVCKCGFATKYKKE